MEVLAAERRGGVRQDNTLCFSQLHFVTPRVYLTRGRSLEKRLRQKEII